MHTPAYLNSPLQEAPAFVRDSFEAAYIPESHPLHSGNPLVDALPPVRSDEDWLRTLVGQPNFEPSQLEPEACLRSYFVEELKSLFFPTAAHVKLARRVDQLIRWGYRHRHPHSPARRAMLQKTYAEAQASGVAVPMWRDKQDEKAATIKVRKPKPLSV